MISPETSYITNADVREIAGDISNRMGFLGEPEFICYGQPTWVIKGSASVYPQDTLAVRLRHTLDPEASLQQTSQQVELMKKLRGHGARVLEFVGKPWIEMGAQDMPGAFVASVSRYLPGKIDDKSYGSAIASLHDASHFVDLSECTPMDPLKSITDVGEAIAYAEERDSAGKPVQIEDVRVTRQHIESLWQVFGQANKLRDQLFETAKNNRSPSVVVQEDVQSNNAGKSYQGVGTLMDVDPFIGPAALDFGRVNNDWPRFKQYDRSKTTAFVAGYVEALSISQFPHTEELELAAAFSDCRTPLIVASLAINGVRAGHRGDAWQLREGLRRLDTIGKPGMEWFSDDNERRIASRAHKP